MRKKIINVKNEYDLFLILCKKTSTYFIGEWENDEIEGADTSEKLLQYQKKAIIGYQKEVNFFMAKINNFLKINGLQNEWYPEWYPDLATAIFHENWGLAGVSKWKNIKNSTSAKVIGEKIFFF